MKNQPPQPQKALQKKKLLLVPKGQKFKKNTEVGSILGPIFVSAINNSTNLFLIFR
jgi:hypothetical protein